jgi:hypothetical protein
VVGDTSVRSPVLVDVEHGVSDAEKVNHPGCKTPSQEMVLTWEPFQLAAIGLIDH